MKAVRIHSYGPSDQLRVEEISRPTPNDNEVLVHVRDVGVNPMDWKIREGHYKDMIPMQMPLTIGQDFSGVVAEVGSKIKNLRPGNRVFGFASGAYAEFAIVTEDKIALIPDRVDFVTAASIPTAGMTAYQLVMNSIELREGQTILIHGAGGGVGSFAVQLALWKKAQVIANAAEEDVDYLKSVGVKEVLDFKKDKFEDRVQDVDAVIDLVGGETLQNSVWAVKKGGVIVSTVGTIERNLAEKHYVRFVSFLVKQNSEDLREIAKLVEEGVLKPRINEIVPLEEAKRAHDDLQKGHSKGKIILEVRSS